MTDHDHYGEYAEERHRHYDLERDDETVQRDIRDLHEDVRDLRATLGLAEERIRNLERLRPTCTRCLDATATQQTATGPACAECAGDPPGDGQPGVGRSWPSESYEAWKAEGSAVALPEPVPYDPGPEAGDEGGMSEYRYILPEDYQRGQS